MISRSKDRNAESIALVHDWLFGLRGGERCLLAFLCLYPEADVFSLFYKKGRTHSIIDSRFRDASFLNSIPMIERFYRVLLPFFPFSKIPQLRNYPVRISLSHAASKNLYGTKKGGRHICYCFTPMRYIWDQAERYLGWKSVFAKPLIWILRSWDRRGSDSVTDFVAISTFVAARIRKYYGRRSRVIFPPVATDWLNSPKTKCPNGVSEAEKAYLFAGALVPYKGAELAIRACSQLKKELWVAGCGPELERLKRLAGPNIKFLGKVSDAELAHLLKKCRALVFPCKEDFGILPLEAQAAGKAVIALYAGACKQTIRGCKHWLQAGKTPDLACQSYTGVFIRRVADSEQLAALQSALLFFEENELAFTESECKAQAVRFSSGSFYDSWKAFASTCPGLSELPMLARDDFVSKFEGLRSEELA